MATIQDIKQRAQQVKDATQIGENTANRVGGVLVDMADHLEEDENQLSSLLPLDAKPIPNSTKPVQSGGVNVALQDIHQQIDGKLGYTYKKGFINYKDGTQRPSSYNYATDYIDVGNFEKIRYTRVSIESTSDSGMAFYDENQNYISGQKRTSAEQTSYIETEIDVPANAKYARFTILGSLPIEEFFVRGDKDILFRIEKIGEEVNQIGEEVNQIEESLNSSIDFDYNYISGFINYLTGEKGVSSVNKATDFIDIIASKKLIYARMAVPTATVNSGMAFYDENQNYISGQKRTSAEQTSYIETEIDVPANAKYARFTILGSLPIEEFFVRGFGDRITQIAARVKKLEDSEYRAQDSYFDSIAVSHSIANSYGNDLIPLIADVDSEGHLLPKSVQHKNVQNKAKEFCLIKWTSKRDIPNRHDTDDGEGVSDGAFSAGTTVTGMPYSSVKEMDKYIGYDVTIHTFMTAVNNPYSLLYTENVGKNTSKSDWGFIYHGENCATYFGTTCSEFSSYCVGMPVIMSTSKHKWLSEHAMKAVRLYSQTLENLQIGDILVRYKRSNGVSMHGMVVVDILKGTAGKVTKIVIAESTGSHVKYTNKTSLNEASVIIAYRYIELYKNIGYDDSASEFIDLSLLPNPTYNISSDSALIESAQKAYSYNNDICVYAGDKSTFAEGELVVLNYNLEDSQNFVWTAIEVYKDDLLLNTYNLADIDTSELVENQVGHALKLGTELSYGSYKARCIDDSGNGSDYTYWEVLNTSDISVETDEDTNLTTIEFTSSNATACCVGLADVSGSHFVMRELTNEELFNGEIKSDFARLYAEQHGKALPVSAVLWVKLYFQGKYGRARILFPYNNNEY